MNSNRFKKIYLICLKNNKKDIINNISLLADYINNINSINELDYINTTILTTMIQHINIFNQPNLLSLIIEAIQSNLEKNVKDIKNNLPTEEDIDVVINLLAKYNYFKKLILTIDDIKNDETSQASINDYLNSNIHVNYIEALINIISDNYLDIPIEKIDFVLDLLLNNEYIDNIINGKVPYTENIRDMLDSYINKIVGIKHMISKEEVEKDKIINAIKNKRIKDIKLIQSLYGNDNPYIIRRIFPIIEDLINYILDLDNVNVFDKEQIISRIIEITLEDENYEYCLNILTSKLKDNIHIKNIVNNNLKNRIINLVYKDIELSPNDVKIFLNNDLLNKNIIANSIYKNDKTKEIIQEILINSNQYTKDQLEATIHFNDTDDEILKKLDVYNYNKKIVSYDVIVRMLTKYYNKEIILNIDQLRPLIRSFTLIEAQNHNLPLNDVVFFNKLDANGEFIIKNKKKYIAINNHLLELFLNPTMQVDKIKLFVTIYHELAHLRKNEIIKNTFIDINTYLILKENIIDTFNKGYYMSNYRNIVDEIEARTSGIHSTKILCTCLFPSLVEAVKKYETTYNAPVDKERFNNKYFEIQNNNVDFEKIFDRIMILHPELLNEYPVLNLEYKIDGAKKTNEEIQDVAYINPKLAEDIITKRYK